MVIECSEWDVDGALGAGEMLLRDAGRGDEDCDSVNTEKDSEGEDDAMATPVLLPKDLEDSAADEDPNLASMLAWILAGTDTRDVLSNFWPSMVRCPVDFSDSICRLASICCLCSSPFLCLSCSRALNWS